MNKKSGGGSSVFSGLDALRQLHETLTSRFSKPFLAEYRKNRTTTLVSRSSIYLCSFLEEIAT